MGPTIAVSFALPFLAALPRALTLVLATLAISSKSRVGDDSDGGNEDTTEAKAAAPGSLPVPPRLFHFATPPSVRPLATVVAGAYPLRLPPDAWLPDLRAPPSRCYWLVASGTPMGWRVGWLAAGLVRTTACYYCVGGCSPLVVCARRSRQVWGVGNGAGSRSSLPSRPSRCVLRVVPSRCPFPSPAGTPFHAVCVFRGLSPIALWVRAAFPFGVGALVLPQHAHPSPPPGSVWRAHYVQFCCRAHVGPFQAPLRVSCPSLVLGRRSSGGGGAVPSSPCLALGRSPPCGRACPWELGLRAVGAARGRPGGGASCLGVEHPGWALSHTPLPVFGACGRGPLPSSFGCGGSGLGDPSRTLQRALLRANFCVLWGRREGARRGRLLPGRGASGVGCSPTPDRPYMGRAARAHYLLASDVGGVGVETCHLPHCARYCKLALHAFGAVRGRPGRGAALAWVWSVQVWALSHARLPVLSACSQGLLPTCCGCGGCWRGEA